MIMVDIDLCAPHAYIGPQHGNGASSRGVGDGHVQTHSERERERETEMETKTRQHVKGGRGRFN